MEVLIFAGIVLLFFLGFLLAEKKPVQSPDLSQDLALLRTQLAQEQLLRQQTTVRARELQNSLSAKQEAYEKLFHQKKSSEVRTGHLGEQILPLVKEFPCPAKTLKFLGSPIDYLSIDYDTDFITFIEVKTGESVLNENQRRVKKMVENGRVKFVTVRLDEKGLSVK